MDSKTFLIPAMADNDAERIKAELEQIQGMRTVEIHAPTHSVTVVWTSPASLDEVWKRLERLHFTPDFPQPF
ncbi:MAG: hypothetical protein ABI835_17560 [Chloroflexota bacterium]